ncbi:MAG: glutamate 5-kinase [Coriobacteriales bacterium]|jgi:glutamate 5-kinase|nr:glutamate 5-kinase [Coriobacteriales bacterium]
MSGIDAKRHYERIVVKVGTSSLVDADGRVDHIKISRLVEQIALVRAKGTKVVLVTSGAITVGLEELQMAATRPDDMPTLQAAAAIGQIKLANHYDYAARMYGIPTAQVLLTRRDTSDRTAYLHARDTVERLLELGVLPIINENDTVAVEEIRFGDNDTLAATVATLIRADLVVLLSDIEGLYTADPRIDEDAELLTRVERFTDELLESAGGAGSATGSGGMLTKIKAARVLMRAGIPMVICEGSRANALVDIVEGDQVGTMFVSGGSRKALQAKKLWIALGDKSRGVLVIDDGACRALRENGGSLLPVGVRQVKGTFGRGAIVNIRDLHGRLVGRGFSRYSSDEIGLAAGKHSDEIAQMVSISSLAGVDVVHRDEMIVF